MGWTPYPGNYLPNWPQAGQDGQGASALLPYTSAQINNPALPFDVRDQMQAAQTAMAAATSTAPHTSAVASGLQALSGFVGGQAQAQADQAAAPYQNQGGGSGQASPSLLASLLRGGPSSTSAVPDDGSMPPAPGWAGVGQGIGQAAQAIGRKSDRRLKSDVVRVGALPNGLAVYRYRLEGGAPEIGLMADEVMALHPEAVWEAEDGFLRVDYSKAVL